MVRILRSDFGDSRLFVLKDPRMCRLVPFWRSVLNEFGAARCFIIPVRHPLEVAASLKARHGFLTAKALLLCSVDAALRAGIFKASGSIDPMGFGDERERGLPRP